MDVIYGSAVSGPVNASALHAGGVPCTWRYITLTLGGPGGGGGGGGGGAG